MQNPQSFCLAPNPAFLPKTSMEVALSSDLGITAFYPEPTNDLEWGFHLMCLSLCLALCIYFRCTEHSRGTNRSLFVHWDEVRSHRPVSKRWISSSLMEAIRSAYCHKGRVYEVVSANPHSIWGMATSWAEIARVPALEICCAATRSGPCTFAQFYRLDFSGGGFGDAVLEMPTRAMFLKFITTNVKLIIEWSLMSLP